MASRKTNTSPCPPEPPQTIALGPDNPLVLTALREDNPRDFLAALGLLRLLDLLYPSCQLSLSWSKEGSPTIRTATSLPNSWSNSLISHLKEINKKTPHPFVHYKVIKVSLDQYRIATLRSLEFLGKNEKFSSLPALLYSSYGSQMHDHTTNEVSPTAFSFSNGQGGKELLRDISEMIEIEFTDVHLHAFLTNDQQKRRDAKSFRWHPAEFRAAAYRASDPGASVKGDVLLDFPVANIFAFFGLTFFPVIDSLKNHKTTGISKTSFTWPIWETWLGGDAIASLLHTIELHVAQPSPAYLQGIGCKSAWRSRRFSSDKSLYFSPAEKIF